MNPAPPVTSTLANELTSLVVPGRFPIRAGVLGQLVVHLLRHHEAQVDLRLEVGRHRGPQLAQSLADGLPIRVMLEDAVDVALAGLQFGFFEEFQRRILRSRLTL